MRRLILLILLLSISGSSAILLWSESEPGLAWRRNYPAALKQAEEQGLPLLVYLYTDWCTYCAQMERETFSDPNLIREMATDFVWVKLQAEKDPAGISIRERERLSNYPVILLLNQQGEEIDQLVGFMTTEKFQSRVSGYLNGQGSLLAFKKRLKVEPQDVDAHFGLGEKYLQRGHFRVAARHFSEVSRFDPENRAELSDAALYYEALAQASAGLEERALSTADQLERLFPSSSYVPDGLILSGRIHYYGGRQAQAQEIFSSFLDRFQDHHSHAWVEQLLRETSN